MLLTRDLVHQFSNGTRLAFPDVAVPRGGTLLLRGPSGSGKSTWLALVAGLLVPSAGSLVVAGQLVADLPPAARDAWRGAQVGFLPQRLHLSEALSVQDNLALVYVAAGLPVDRTAIGERLAALGVAHLAGVRPARLSGGEAQRVALARALLRQPKVVLADEPTASLDDAACSAALGVLQVQAARAGATLVMATHDARVAQALPMAQVLQLVPGRAA